MAKLIKRDLSSNVNRFQILRHFKLQKSEFNSHVFKDKGRADSVIPPGDKCLGLDFDIVPNAGGGYADASDKCLVDFEPLALCLLNIK